MQISNNLIHGNLSYILNGIFFKVQNELGRFSTERQYADAVEELLKETDILYEREKEIPIKFGEKELKGNRVDFWIASKLLVDAKAKKYITREDYLQMRRYLKAVNFKLGLIVNFRGKSVMIKRVINPSAKE